MMLPSVFYQGVHGDHQRPNTFGTECDPEYPPLCARRRAIAASCLSSLTPLLLPLRFLVAGPLGLVYPPLQRLLEVRYSSISVNPRYRRSVYPADHRRIVRAQIAVLLFWGLAVGLAAAQILPWRTFAIWYVVCTCVYILNEVRGLGVHRYQSEGKPVDRLGQLRDSIDTAGGFGGWSCGCRSVCATTPCTILSPAEVPQPRRRLPAAAGRPAGRFRLPGLDQSAPHLLHTGPLARRRRGVRK